jgi:Zn-dependent alcohol dehydrogenase
MKIRAAVMRAPGRPLEVCGLELAPPARDEVLVRILASGVCRSDLSYIDGKWPAPLPIVLGHEGAGTIEAVGEGVDPQRIGERVVLTFAPACGRCRHCLAGRANLCLDAALALDVELDPALACLLGCGVTTGVMSVTRRANVRPGDAVAIFGCGGVGLSALLGARMVSALPLIAVDPLAAKRRLALELGATHAVDPGDGDPAEQLRAIVPGGVDFAFEALGRVEVADQAFRSVREGGTTVLIGQPPIGLKAGFDVYNLTQFEHTILGSNLGGAVPALHVPALARLVAAGLLEIAPLVTHRFALEEINEAIATTASGEAGRVVVLP